MVCIDRIFLLLFSFLPHFGYCDESSLAESGRDRFPEVCQPGGDPLCSVSLVPISISNSDDSEALRSHAQSEAPYSLPLIVSAWRGSPLLWPLVLSTGGHPLRSGPWCPSPSATLVTLKPSGHMLSLNPLLTPTDPI